VPSFACYSSLMLLDDATKAASAAEQAYGAAAQADAESLATHQAKRADHVSAAAAYNVALKQLAESAAASVVPVPTAAVTGPAEAAFRAG
jgi:hypothetical protein